MKESRDKSLVILVGGFHEVIELCEFCGKKIFGIIDNQFKKQYLGYNILGSDHLADKIYKKYGDIPVVITPDNPLQRRKLVGYYSKIGFNFCNLIHPNATISQYAKIGKGVVIQNGVNVSSNVVIKDFVKINTFVNIMHDSLIGKFTTIAPNAVVLGRVKISESCYVGANSTILQGKMIGRKAIIGAGAVVTKDVDDNVTVIGFPARKMIK